MMIIRTGIIIALYLYLVVAEAAVYTRGDVAPRGTPDGLLDVADVLVLTRLVNGEEAPSDVERIIGDVAPSGTPDNALDVSDILVLQRAVSGEIALGSVTILPPSPTLDPISSPVSQNPFQISGTASPNSLINIYVNDVQQRQVQSQSDGSFSLGVYLFDGLNTIYAAEFDGEDESDISNVEQVEYHNTIDRQISGTVSTDTVWTPGNPSQPYIISSDLVIASGATLILQPGTEVRFAAGSELTIEGGLEIRGNDISPVILTKNGSTNWVGLYVSSGAANVSIDHAVIEYASRGVSFLGNGVIRNSELRENSRGIYADGSSPQIVGNYIHDNWQGIYLYGGANPQVSNNNIITLNYDGLYLRGNGSGNYPQPTVNGNQIYDNNHYNVATNEYVYSNAIPSVNMTGNWWGVTIIGQIANEILDYNDDPTNKAIVDFGSYLDGPQGEPVSGNYLTYIASDTTLNGNASYQALGTLVVEAGVMLTIEAGAELNFIEDAELIINGGLHVLGNAANPVYFNLNFGESKNWGGIFVSATAGDVSIAHAVIEDADRGIDFYSDGTIQNSELRNNTYGIYASGSSPQIIGNYIHDNNIGVYLRGNSTSQIYGNNIISMNRTGLYLGGDGTDNYPEPVVNGNQFTGNSLYAVRSGSYQYTGPVPVIDLTANWWGTVALHEIASMISDYTDSTYSRPIINYGDYLGGPQGVPASGPYLLTYIRTDTNLNANTVYQVLGNLVVESGVTLTIESGAALNLIPDAEVLVNGGIQVQGTDIAPVQFDLSQGAPGKWDGIVISNSASNVSIDYAVIEDADQGVSFYSNGSIRNSELRHNTRGIYVDGNAPHIVNNYIHDNSDGIYLYRSTTAQIYGNNVITQNHNGLYLSGYNTGDYPRPLVNGNQIYGNSNYEVETYRYRYTGTIPVVDMTGNWWGTTVISRIADKIFDYTDDPTSIPIIDYSNYLYLPDGTPVGGNYLTYITSNTTLSNNSVYQVLGTLVVESGVTLTVEAGADLNFISDAGLIVNGSLQVLGADGSPVNFNLYPGEVGEWRGIVISDSASNVLIDKAVIENADRGVDLYSDGVIRNSELRNNTYGIYATNSSPEIEGNYIHGNNMGVYLYGDSDAHISHNNIISRNRVGLYLTGYNSSDYPQPVVNGNQLYNNTAYSISLSNYQYTGPVPVIDVTGNWWGTASLHKIASQIYDYTDNTTNTPVINYGDYLGGPEGVPVSGPYLLPHIGTDTNLNPNTVYQVLGNLIVEPGATLTIEAGTILNLIPDAEVLVNGGLQVLGSDIAPVEFKLSEGAPGEWDGLVISDGASNVSIRYAIIEHANQGVSFYSDGSIKNSELRYNTRGIYVDGNAPYIVGNYIHENTDGIYLYGDTTAQIYGNNVISNNENGLYLRGHDTGNYPQPVVNGNQIYGNSNYEVETFRYLYTGAVPVVDMTGNWWGAVDANQISAIIWDYTDQSVNMPIVNFAGYAIDEAYSATDNRQPLLATSPISDMYIPAGNYLVISDINIPAGVSIVFEAGAKVEFVNSTGIYVHGSLSINGMADDPVTLVSVGGGTSSYWDRNGFEWEGLYLHNDAANVDINYAYISFARWGVYFDNTGGHVANSIFKENEYGIYIDGASAPVIEDNTIVQNRIGFYLNGYSADPDPTVVRNDIYANTQYNLHLYNIDNNTILNFSNNWWGTDVIADIRATIHTAGTTDQYASLLLDSIASEANQSLIPYNIAINGRYISPATSSGIQDNVTLSASLGQSAPWAIEVVNSSGLTVRNFSGTGDSIHIDWDGTSNSANNVPDDVYTFVFVASSSLHMGRVVLDNTLPAAHFASGIDGSMINTGQVLLEGIASDDYFSSYRVEYGAGASPSTWTLIDSIKTVPVTSGNLVSWIVADDGAMEPLLDGIYSIRLTVNDLAGNSSLEVIQVTINTLSIHSVSQDLVTFNPIGGESARVSFTINDPAIVTLKIASQIDGSIVRSVSQNYTTAGDHYLEWDGLDDNGQYVVDEAYLYTLVAEDGVRQASYSPEFVPEVGQITGDNRISYSVSKNNFWKNYVNLAYSSRVKLCIGTQQSMPDIDCDSAGQYVAIDNEPYEAGNHWLYWDGRVEGGDALKGKDHKFHLAAIETLPPNTIIVKGNIPSLRGESGTAPNIEIKSNPYKVRHSYDEVSTVKYIIDQNSYITIKLLPPDINDPADSSAIVLVSEQLQMAEESPGIPATYMFEWKGYDDSVPVPDTNNIVIDTNGRYTFTIQATSAETGYSTLYRGSLRLYH